MKKIPVYKSFCPSKNIELLMKGRLKFFTDVTNNESELTSVALGKRNMIIANSSESIKHFMIDNYKNYEKRTNIITAFGRNSFTTSGDEWVEFRRPLMPLFSKKNLQSNFFEMDQIISQFYIEQNKNDQEFVTDAAYYFSKLVFNMNTAILVGTDLSHEFDSMHADLVFMNQYFNELYYRFVKTGFLNKLLYDKVDRELTSTVDRVNKKVRDIAFGKEKIRENSALFRLLEIYKSENKKISEEDIVNQTKMLLFAGYETTSLTLTWLTYYLSDRPNLQEELFNELKNLTFLNIEDLSNSRLTKSVLLETLRIRPIGWGFTRYAIQDDSYGEYEIKADDCIFISPYLIHHKDKYYSDASTFNERRFMDINTRDLGTKFLTFGAGPRTCVGEELALIQLILAVRSLIVNFTFKNTTGEIECNPQTTLMLKKTFNVSFKRRILK